MNFFTSIKIIASTGLLVASLFVLLSLQSVSAASTNEACSIPGASSSSYCQDKNNAPTSTNPIISILKSAINVVSYMAGVAAVIAILISSIKFMTANGDANNISSAKRTLVFAAVGIIVVIIAQSIVAFALKKY
jgi:hypothetical protein